MSDEYQLLREELMDFEQQVEDFERLVEEAAGKEELLNLKKWLFAENIRILEEKKRLGVLLDQVAADKAKLTEDNAYFDKKMAILKRGFEELNADKKRFAEEKRREEAWLRQEREELVSFGDNVTVFFKGVDSPFMLKKRYRDLLKLFHPDNMGGDHQMVVKINQEYERLKKNLEYGKHA